MKNGNKYIFLLALQSSMMMYSAEETKAERSKRVFLEEQAMLHTLLDKYTPEENRKLHMAVVRNTIEAMVFVVNNKRKKKGEESLQFSAEHFSDTWRGRAFNGLNFLRREYYRVSTDNVCENIPYKDLIPDIDRILADNGDLLKQFAQNNVLNICKKKKNTRSDSMVYIQQKALLYSLLGMCEVDGKGKNLLEVAQIVSNKILSIVNNKREIDKKPAINLKEILEKNFEERSKRQNKKRANQNWVTHCTISLSFLYKEYFEYNEDLSLVEIMKGCNTILQNANNIDQNKEKIEKTMSKSFYETVSREIVKSRPAEVSEKDINDWGDMPLFGDSTKKRKRDEEVESDEDSDRKYLKSGQSVLKKLGISNDIQKEHVMVFCSSDGIAKY
ncbi:MAG TPA: hypothetical protein VEK38_01365 [Candidatus Bathyarchaeia archaeon]|nr:hypothetical protein [Candidatus Bathyarchaeia archaeon]